MAVNGNRNVQIATPPRSGTAAPVTVRQKRTASGRANNDRAVKRRSPRACLSCRSRKVRCDVVNGGIPCTNCRLDSVECVLTETSRGRKPSDGANLNIRPAVSPPAPQPATPHTQQATPPHNEQSNDYILSLTFEDQQSGSQSGELGDENESQDDRSRYGMMEDGRGINGHPHQPQDRLPQYGDAAVANAMSPVRSQRSHGSLQQNRVPSTNGRGAHLDDAPIAPLPPYIKPLPRHIGRRDIEYLHEKDALTIPDDKFRDELLRTYIKIIHIFMPAIELEKLLVPIIKADGQNPISLLLFQAVMFASVIFVASDTLQSRGFTSRKAARKIFFNRVRLLYGLDCEPDRLTLIQSLLLMTYWYDSPEDEKDTWYWMGITLSLSQVLGLHRDPETLNMSLQKKRLRRQIWWSCYIRDRLLALGIRRPARIRQEDFNVAMLELDDFELAQPTQEHIAFVKACGFTTPEGDRRRAMCQICIELAKLCVCIGDILHSQYSVVSFQAYSSEHYKNVAVLPKDSQQQQAELVKCDAKLEEWHRNQKTTCRYSPPSPSSSSASVDNDSRNWEDKIIWLHQALLRMIYLTAVGALHRPQALGSNHRAGGWDTPENNAAKKASIRKVKEAAAAVTRLAFDLQSENYLRYLSTSSIPAFLSATLIHLLDVRNGNEEVRNLAIGRFYQCFHALFELQDMYSSAEYAIRFLENVLKRMNANIPMLAMLRLCVSTMTESAGYFKPVGARDAPSVSPYENYSIPMVGQQARTLPSSNENSFSMPAPTVASQSNISMTDNANNRQPNQNLDYLLDGASAPFNPDPSTQLGNTPFTQPFGDHFLDSTSHLEVWTEMDGLLPALIDFDADPLTGVTNHDVRTPNRSWPPYNM